MSLLYFFLQLYGPRAGQGSDGYICIAGYVFSLSPSSNRTAMLSTSPPRLPAAYLQMFLCCFLLFVQQYIHEYYRCWPSCSAADGIVDSLAPTLGASSSYVLLVGWGCCSAEGVHRQGHAVMDMVWLVLSRSTLGICWVFWYKYL